MRRGYALAVFLLALAAPARGDVKLEWKFKADDRFFAEEVTTIKMTLDDGATVKVDSETETTTVYAFTVKQADRDTTLLEEKIDSIKVMSKGDGAGRLDRILEGLKGTVFTLTLNREGQVTKLEGYDEALKKLAPTGDDAAAKLLRTVFTEEVVSKGASQLFGALPVKAVSEGAHWKRDGVLPLGSLGSFRLATLYIYKGKAKDGEEVALDTTATYQVPKEGGTSFKIVKADLKGDGKGQVFFDTEAGRLAREDSTLKITGPLTLDVGKETTVQVHVEQTRKVRVSDKPPQE